jgi:hypothetical protein
MNYLNLAKEILEKNGIYNHNSNKEEAPAV